METGFLEGNEVRSDDVPETVMQAMEARMGAMTDEQKVELHTRLLWSAFMTSAQAIAKTIRANNEAKGFGIIPEVIFDGVDDDVVQWAQDRLDATAIGLIHGEVSEMMEARRRPGWQTDPSEHIPEFTALVEEGADVLIRLFDLFQRLGLMDKLVQAVPAKVAFNTGRPFKHGRTF